MAYVVGINNLTSKGEAYMTWIAGVAVPLGYALVISDVRVSWPGTGLEPADCLQKVYQIAPFILAGFAGSIDIGFNMLDDLSEVLNPIPEGMAWSCRVVANWWHRRARRIFSQADQTQKKHGCSILLAGVSPVEDLGDPAFPRPDIVIMKHPEFKPVYAPLGQWVSIGDGAKSSLYLAKLKELSFTVEPQKAKLWEFETTIPAMVAQIASEIATTCPRSSVSPHCHVFIAKRGAIGFATNNKLEIRKDGTRVNFCMPKVATNREEFEVFCQDYGSSICAAVGQD